MFMQRIVCFLLGLILTISSTDSFASYRPSFSVMSYNLENLFDSLHDEGTNDYTFLPLLRKNSDMEVRRYCASINIPYYRKQCFELDWNTNVVLNKIQNVSRVIREADQGKSPDIIVFQEVENINVLRKLIDIGLDNEGYRELVLVEGPDRRGIDVAIISKLPLVDDVKYHDIDLTEAYPPGQKIKLTRGILEATFNFKGKVIKVLANHWPSQANKDITRVIAANKLMEVTKKSDVPVIAAGDFNTEEKDKVNPIKEIITNSENDFYFVDVEEKFFDEYDDGTSHRGTHYYRKKWSSLDKIFVPKSHLVGRNNCELESDCIFPIWRSYEVIKFSYMLEEQSYTSTGSNPETKVVKVPKRFDPLTGTGVSDHLPVLMRFSF